MITLPMYNPQKIVKNPQFPVIIISGGAGFIGSYLVEALLSQNFRIVVIDSMETGKKDYITQFSSHPRVGFIEHNLNLGIPEKVESVDFIVNLAAQELHLEGSSEVNVESLFTNALSTRNLLELAKNSGARILLTSSVNVYQGIASSSNLKNYFGESEKSERSFSYNESKRFAESLAFEYYKKYGVDVRIARLGEVYGPRMDLAATSNLGRFIKSILNDDNLSIYGDGIEKEYYCYISDTIEGLAKVLFKPGIAGNIYPITEITPITPLELAYLCKNFSLPGTQVVFKPAPENYKIPDFKVVDGKLQRDLRWKPKINLVDGIKITLEYLGFNKDIVKEGAARPQVADINKLPENHIPVGRYNKEETKSIKLHIPKIKFNTKFLNDLNLKYKPRNILLLSVPTILILTLSVFFPQIRAVYNLALAYSDIKNLEGSIKKFNITILPKQLDSLNNHLTSARNAEEEALLLKDIEFTKLLSSLSLTAQSGVAAFSGIKPLIDQISNQASISIDKTNEIKPSGEEANLSLANERLSEALDLLNQSKAIYKEVNTLKLPIYIKQDKLQIYQRLLNDMGEALIILSTLSKPAPSILGYDSTKSYLILFQNSNEIRPTGGFIGSIGKLSVKSGQIEDIKILDVYDIDGQIDERNIVIMEPKYLSDNLHTTSLHLRDANYSPSFPDSAKLIKDIYTRVTGDIVDGVIAIDLSTIENLLKVTGPIFLPTYNENIGSDNLFERAQFHSETAYYPGSVQKKTFLSVLSQQLFQSIISTDRGRYLSLLSTVKNLLNEKHILIYIPDEQSYISKLNWDGRIINTANDYVMVVDTNVGSNKSNYFVSKSMNYQIEKTNREGEYVSELKIGYIHSGTSNAWPGGPYKNYLRVYLPNKTSLLRAGSSQNAEDSYKEDITDKIEINQEDGKTVFSVLVTVNTAQKTYLTFNYVLAPSSDSIKYALTVQKQPGTKNDSLTLEFKLPFGINAGTIPEGFKEVNNALKWAGVLDHDLNFSFPFK